VALSLASPPGAVAQSAAIAADLMFYGDDTEFSNPFRDGDTLFGNWGRVVADLTLNDTVSVQGGVFGNYRYGDFARVGQLRPVLSLTLARGPSRVVFGTLETVARRDGPGPDITSPHGLLPAFQVETLAFTRPWEAGLQWVVDSTRVRQDAWINWQALNTPEHREKFDVGVDGRLRVTGPWRLLYQTHVVHHGGQRYASGPVSDSVAGAIGAAFDGPLGGLDRVVLEGWGVASRYTADREVGETLDGHAMFLRAAAERSGWRGHVIVWRGWSVFVEEGDPNYQSVRQDGTLMTSVRDYAEAGATRTFRPSAETEFEVSARWHRVEQDYDYSFRLLARARLRWPHP
jgi:hypothetical protein